LIDKIVGDIIKKRSGYIFTSFGIFLTSFRFV